MSNQRAGKTHRAAMGDDSRDLALKNFFKVCAEVLEPESEDAAFYFEQIKEYLEDGGKLPSDRREIQRILGI